MRKLIIDTDTASDDAIALVLALRWPDVEIKAVTTVAGNVPVEAATRNAMDNQLRTGGSPARLTRRVATLSYSPVCSSSSILGSKAGGSCRSASITAT